MTSPNVRRAGRATLLDGAQLIWTVADGRRGRRWRAMTTVLGTLTHALLLEVNPDGRISRVELTTAAGLLTLHPEADETELHGNVATPEGMRHLTFAWSPDHALQVEGRPLASAVAARHLGSRIRVGEAAQIPVIVIDAALLPGPAVAHVERHAKDRWLFERDGVVERFRLDADGVPIRFADAVDWPLEA